MSNNQLAKGLLAGIGGVVMVSVALVCACLVGGLAIVLWLSYRPVAPPPELHEGISQMEGAAPRRLFSSPGLQQYVPGIQNGTVVVAEVTLESGATERRAFLELNQSQSVYLGPLRAIPAGGPVELLFFEVNGSRLAVAWVDPDLTSQVLAVSIIRSEQQGDTIGDDELSPLSDGIVDEQVAFIPLRHDDRWRELLEVRVGSTDQQSYVYRETIVPPYPLSEEFERHSITWA